MTTKPPEYAPSITLAQQALEIYHQKGEFAMLPFIMNNFRPSEENKPDWQERGYCQLDDGSDVVHHKGKYIFGWHNQETGKQTHTQRYSAMPDNGRPEPTKTAETPVMKWPNREDVWSSVIDIIEFRSEKHTEKDVITETDVSYQLAPSLHHAISKAISDANNSKYVKKYVDNISTDIAEVAINMMQPDELQALIDHASDPESRPEHDQPNI